MITGFLPRISYNTSLDWYVMASLFNLGINCFFCVLPFHVPRIPYFNGRYSSDQLNRALVAIMGILNILELAYRCLRTMLSQLRWRVEKEELNVTHFKPDMSQKSIRRQKERWHSFGFFPSPVHDNAVPRDALGGGGTIPAPRSPAEASSP